MKTKFTNIILVLILMVINLSSCILFSDEETDKRCKENEMSSPSSISMNVKCRYLINSSNAQADATHNVFKATELFFLGVTRSMSCRNEEITHFDFDNTINPSGIDGKYGYYFDVDPYTFPYIFTNYLEYVSVDFKILATFSDGKMFRSSEVVAYTAKIDYWWDNSGEYTFDMNQAITWEPANQ